MPKTGPGSRGPSLIDYAPVAERVARFYERHPEGRIITRLVSITDRGADRGGGRGPEREIIVVARVYRTTRERRPAATGWAAEREGDGDINTVACLENTETSAVGRALANLGILASPNRPSREEMAKADRERAAARLRGLRSAGPGAPEDAALQRRADETMELVRLVAAAERAGLSPERAQRLVGRLTAGAVGVASAARLGRAMTSWIAARLRMSLLVVPPAPPGL